MALATQCPFCQTTFRVAQDQLKLRGGLVRCGSCKEVFNGNDHLVSPEIAQQLVVTPAAADTPTATQENRVAPTAWPTLPGRAVAPATPSAPAKPVVPTPVAAPTSTRQNPSAAPTSAPLPAPPSALVSANLSAAFASLAAETEDAPWGTQNSPTAAPASTTSSTSPATPSTTAEPGSINTLTQELSYPIPLTSSAPQSSNPGSVADAGSVITTMQEPSAMQEITSETALDDAIDQALNALAADTTSSVQKPAGNKADAHSDATETADGETEEEHEEAEEEEEDEEDIDEDTPAFVQKAERRERLRKIARVIMSVGAVIFSIALLLQATYFWRNTIVAWLPATRPLLSSVCATLHCSVGFPTNIEQLSLESSELQLVPPNQNIYNLTVLLRNRGYSTQAWPYMELTLNDADEKAITRRVFTPREYLRSTQQVDDGFAGEGEQQVKMTFELTQPAASGYRVYLFFP